MVNKLPSCQILKNIIYDIFGQLDYYHDYIVKKNILTSKFKYFHIYLYRDLIQSKSGHDPPALLIVDIKSFYVKNIIGSFPFSNLAE